MGSTSTNKPPDLGSHDTLSWPLDRAAGMCYTIHDVADNMPKPATLLMLNTGVKDAMRVPLQQEILELLKQKLLPELEQLGRRIAKADQDSRERDAQLLEAIRTVDMASRERDAVLAAAITSVQADLKVLTGRLDTLEVRMQERFAEIDKRFEQVDKRFEQIDKRFEQVEQSIRELHADLREVRSLMFVGKAQQLGYQLHDK